jgi:hypothetical protein
MAEETCLLTEIIRSIVKNSTTFGGLPSRVGIAPEDDRLWNNWVRQMIDRILAVDALSAALRTVISFIG